VARYYRRPPWELEGAPENEIVAEAEYIDLEEEIARGIDPEGTAAIQAPVPGHSEDDLMRERLLNYSKVIEGS